ncbi:MAG: leucyl/phenylalanyl-tRNA--protein transferase [Bacteroidota bacterium]
MPVYQLPSEYIFPDPNEAEDGLIAVGGDLSPIRLLTAYSCGIFPWFNPDEEILWWSPNPRLVLFPEDIKISKSLLRIIKSKKFTVKLDTNFSNVIKQCKNICRKDADGTWITDDMEQAYIELHRIGAAHSVEIYENNELVGGLYGVSIGKGFFGESMFSIKPNASKIALVYLANYLKALNFHFIDAQVPTDHLISMGAKEISRKDFLTLLDKALDNDSKIGSWY